MMKITRLLLSAALLSTVASSSASAAAVPVTAAAMVDANKILAEIDRRAAAFEDQQYTATMTIIKGGDTKQTLTFDMAMKGLDKQFITFTAPGDVAGMKVLMQDADTLYVYMPEFKKVRRVASHVQNQGFLGSQFTYEDMTQVGLSRLFDASLVGKEGSETTLTLTPKEGVTSTYARIDIVIDGTKGGVTKLRYYDGAGNHVRQQDRDEWKKIEGQLVPTRITMTDLKSKDSTVIELGDVKVNQGIADDLFSRRMLLRG
jgi:outer membrane lipoprotein-sorting protein